MIKKGYPTRAKAGANRPPTLTQILDSRQTVAISTVTASDATKLADAPNDVDYYGRKGLAWVRLSQAGLPPV